MNESTSPNVANEVADAISSSWGIVACCRAILNAVATVLQKIIVSVAKRKLLRLLLITRLLYDF